MRMITTYPSCPELDALALDKAVREQFKASREIPTTRWGFDTRPVFLLTFYDGERMVVKQEVGRAGGGDVLKLGGALMGAVSPSAKSEPLDSMETSNLFAIASEKKTLDHYYLLAVFRDPSALWHKMSFVENLKFGDKMLEASKGHKVLGKLMEGNALQVLGRIVAVDRFLGNNDRFTGAGKIQNKGNVIFHKQEDSRYLPVGLDFYEAQGEMSNLATPAPSNWDGMVLKNDQTIAEYANTCVDSLNAAFGAGVACTNLLSFSCKARFAKGMQEGVQAMRAFLCGKKDLAPGTIDRMNKLGWQVGWKQGVAPGRGSGIQIGQRGHR